MRRQKPELLRGILTYFHYATRETREEVLCAEINRVNAGADELRERFRSKYVPPIDGYEHHDAATTIINGRHHRRDLV